LLFDDFEHLSIAEASNVPVGEGFRVNLEDPGTSRFLFTGNSLILGV
jgi:hypothetical protein